MNTCFWTQHINETPIPHISIVIDAIRCRQEEIEIAIVVVVTGGSCGITDVLRNPGFTGNRVEPSLTEIVVECTSGFTMCNEDVYIPIVIKISRECFSRVTLSRRDIACISGYKGLFCNISESLITVISIHCVGRSPRKEIQITIMIVINWMEQTGFCSRLCIFDDGRCPPISGRFHPKNPYALAGRKKEILCSIFIQICNRCSMWIPMLSCRKL